MVFSPFRLQKEVESLRLNSISQQSEATRLTTCLTSVHHETKELQEELERRDNIIKTKVIELNTFWEEMLTCKPIFQG